MDDIQNMKTLLLQRLCDREVNIVEERDFGTIFPTINSNDICLLNATAFIQFLPI